jgi:dUTP pyrophosphatase
MPRDRNPWASRNPKECERGGTTRDAGSTKEFRGSDFDGRWTGEIRVASPIMIRILRKSGCQDVPLPRYMSEHASGMDVYAACDGDITIGPGDVKLVSCGFYLAVPVGYEGQIRPRSGLAIKHGVIVPNSPGTIDADYRGEVCVILANVGREPFVVRRGMRIAQMVIAPVTRASVAEVAELDETSRGEGGFGHTGV